MSYTNQNEYEYENEHENMSMEDENNFFTEMERVTNKVATKQEVKIEQDLEEALASMPVLKWGQKKTSEQNENEVTDTSNAPTDEFPALGTSIPETRKQKIPFTVGKKYKPFAQHGGVGLSYRESKSGRYRKNGHNRDAAFDILSNKTQLEKRLMNTSMCTNYLRNRTCRHGSNCRYAHSIDELRMYDCLFGKNCKHVSYQGNNIVDNGGKKCKHRHPEETREMFFKRTGLDKYVKSKTIVPTTPTHTKPLASGFTRPTAGPVTKSLSKTFPEPFAKPVPLTVNRWTGSSTSSNSLTPPTLSRTPSPKLFQSSPQSPPPLHLHQHSPLQNTEVLIKVPLSMAMSSLEIALREGKRNITLELV